MSVNDFNDFNGLVPFKSDGTRIFADSLQAGPFPTLTLGLPSMAALAADVGHLCNPTSVAHIRRYGNIPAFKLPTLLNVTHQLNPYTESGRLDGRSLQQFLG